MIVTDVSANSSFISHQIRNLSVLFASMLQEEKNKPIGEEIEPEIKKGYRTTTVEREKQTDKQGSLKY